ncbi:MAG TPA: WbqC family protein [Nitrososphaerales archaeon]|nr:WbqC family protein [Nitrososphaerales archaeon]
MRAAIHQPQYFPYPGFFHKLTLADIFVVMDETQYDKRFTNRNRILDAHGPIWLSVPINKSQKFLPNRLVEINNEIPWREDHWKKILLSYGNSRFFELYRSLESIYSTEWSFLFELNLETMKKTMQWLGIDTPIVRESELQAMGESTERLVNICKSLGADTYISGIGGKGYLQEELFESNHLKLEYQSYRPVPYPQRFSKTFIPNLSIIDMLSNAGPESVRLIGEAQVPQVAPLPHSQA